MLGKIFTFKSVMLLILIIGFTTAEIKAQAIGGTINVGSGQTFTSLTANSNAGLFRRINNSGLNANLIVNITSNITESGDINLGQWTTGSGFTVTIRPSAGTTRTLSGAHGTALISLDGADNVVIDGRFNGSGNFLTFRNTNTSGSTFDFLNDATGNTIRNCTIEGACVSATRGVINFSTTTGTTGNDNNTITNCNIKDANTTPQIMIYSNGTASTSARYNSGNTISGNNIYDFYRSGQICSGITLEGGTTDWDITGNSFYQTSARSTNTATFYFVIYINTSNANNTTISGNYLGGGEPNCGGSAWSFSGTAAHTMYFIRFANAGTSTASNVNGNFIQNISYSATPNTNGVVYFAGILVENGAVNVGNSDANTIGNSTSTGNISISFAGSTDNVIVRGVDHRRTGVINNTSIGSINIGGTSNGLVRFEGIYYSNTASFTVSNNIIGSLTTANSINASSTGMESQLAGIYTNTVNSTTTVTGNTVANMTVASTSSTAYLRGIVQANYADINFSNNTVAELRCAGTSTSRAPSQAPAIGILTVSNSTNQIVSGNTIRGIRNTGNASTYVTAFGHTNQNSVGVFSRNRVYDITNSSTSGTPRIWAINAYWGSWTYSNNQITVTNGEAADFTQYEPGYESKNRSENPYQVDLGAVNTPGFSMDVTNYARIQLKPEFTTDAFTNNIEVKGIHDEAQMACYYYYNSVYVGGTQSSGSSNSWGYDRPLSDWPTIVTMRNNIFYNARTGGTGKHYAIGNEIGFTNWGENATNYNVFIAANPATVAIWALTDRTIDQWRTSSLCDRHSWSTTTSVIPQANLFQGISTGNLNIVTGNSAAWIVSGKGIAISGLNTDFSGNARVTTISGGNTDIGAFEFTATPPGNPVATASGAPGSGLTTYYRIYGRDVIALVWGTGGSSYPSAINVNYYSGINPPNVVSGAYANSYWSVVPTGNLTGTTYEIILNFGDNETYGISSPNVNTRLARYNTSAWIAYVASGTASLQSELDYNGTWVRTRGLNAFTNFTLTDETSPLPVEMCSFNAQILKRDIQLNWVTCTELNNMGFDVERRAFDPRTNDYSQWVKTGFVEGRGTTNEQQTYKYTDHRLSTGRYQYRLKQVDFNGNYEYHSLNSPAELVVGVPGNADLFQNYPNPSNPTSKVDFQIPFAGRVSLKVYDIAGKEVASLVDANMEGGYYTAEFNGSSLASGVYFYRLIAVDGSGNNFSKTMKLILVK